MDLTYQISFSVYLNYNMNISIFGRVSIQSASYKRHMHKSLLIEILYIEMLHTYIDAMKTFYFEVMNFQKFSKSLMIVYVDFFCIF